MDIDFQRHYPFTFVQADALTYPLDGFDAIHASPPCQAFSKAQTIRGRLHEDYISATRARLREAGVPYVIENVAGAPLRDPYTLCGLMFGLPLYRHRLFETSFTLVLPAHPEHKWKQTKMGRPPQPDEVMHIVGNFSGVEQARVAMETPWMTRNDMAQAIPPAYTAFIGNQLKRTPIQPTTGEPCH